MLIPVSVSSAAATNLSCIIAFFLWKPDPNQLYVFFVLSALWGMADAIWQTQTNGRNKKKNPKKNTPTAVTVSTTLKHLLFIIYGGFKEHTGHVPNLSLVPYIVH